MNTDIFKYFYKDKNIKAIIFDNGGTLKVELKHQNDGLPFIMAIMEIIPTNRTPEDFKIYLDKGHDKCKEWAENTYLEPSEAELWTRFLYPDFPNKQFLVDNASILTDLYMNSRGDRVILEETHELITTLEARGYLIGMVSNTRSKTVVPNEYEAIGLRNHFKSMILSSVEGIRKPNPILFEKCCKELGVKLSEAVYIGDDPSRDVEGPRLAGMAEPIIIRGPKTENISKYPKIQQPKIIVNSLNNLIDIFQPICRMQKINSK